MADQGDPTVALAHVVAAAVVRDAGDRPAMLLAAHAIASGDERAASRFGYCMASAIVGELLGQHERGRADARTDRIGSPWRYAAKGQARSLSPTCAACAHALENVPTR
jgi:hypothetical protein